MPVQTSFFECLVEGYAVTVAFGVCEGAVFVED